MELVFLLQRNSYFVEQAKAWYRVDSDQECALALALLPLRVVDEFELIEQPHQRGFARLNLESEARVTLALVLPDGETVATTEIGIDERCLVRATWLDRQYRDGWMPASARIELEGVSRFSLQAYLPPKAGALTKTLTVKDETSGVETVWEMTRDGATSIQVVGESFAGKRTFSLRCEPETVSDSSDTRPLGFVLVDEDIAVSTDPVEPPSAETSADDAAALVRAA